jgi:hypothetical protein
MAAEGLDLGAAFGVEDLLPGTSISPKLRT